MVGSENDAHLHIAINKWDGNSVKYALDDAAKELLKEEHDLIESHRLFDGRLLLGTLCVIIALYAVVYDFLHPFPESKFVLIICVHGYFITTTLLSAYTILVEKNIFFIGMEKAKPGHGADKKWTLSSNMKKYDDQYTLTVSVLNESSRAVVTADMTRSIADFIDVKGNVRVDLYWKAIQKLCEDLTKSKKTK